MGGALWRNSSSAAQPVGHRGSHPERPHQGPHHEHAELGKTCHFQESVGEGDASRARRCNRQLLQHGLAQELVGIAHQAHDGPHGQRSEEHTSELQSPCNLVCRLLLEKKKYYTYSNSSRTSTALPPFGSQPISPRVRSARITTMNVMPSRLKPCQPPSPTAQSRMLLLP